MRRERGLTLQHAAKIAGGTNNRLFRVTTAEGTPLLVKLYQPDEWNRQQREFTTLACLHMHGLHGVPAPLWQNEALGYNVLSFEAGDPPPPVSLTSAHTRALAGFAARLHSILPDGEAATLAETISPTLSLVQQCTRIEQRLAMFEQAAASADADAALRRLAQERPLRVLLEPQIAHALAGLTRAEIDAPLPRTAYRLTSGDFGAHNLLLNSAGTVTVIDWEWAGWDDPV